MPDEFGHLYGRLLVPFVREEASNLNWDLIFVSAGSVSLDSLVELMAGGGYPNPNPKPMPSAPCLAAIEAVRTGRLRLLADGDHTLVGSVIDVALVL